MFLLQVLPSYFPPFKLYYYKLLFRSLTDVSGDCSDTEQNYHCAAYEHFVFLLFDLYCFFVFLYCVFSISRTSLQLLCSDYLIFFSKFSCLVGYLSCCVYIISHRPLQLLCSIHSKRKSTRTFSVRMLFKPLVH